MKRPREINITIGIVLNAIIALTVCWIMWFAAPQLIRARTPEAPDYQVYVSFEQAFQLADGYIAITALTGVIGLLGKLTRGDVLWEVQVCPINVLRRPSGT